MVTDKKGHYTFKTIKPAAYGVRENGSGRRTSTTKVYRRGFEDLTTQLYFAGDPLNAKDGIYSNVLSEKDGYVTVDFKPAPQIGSDLPSSPMVSGTERSREEDQQLVGLIS